LKWERVWLESDDKERFAVDWVFPPGGFDPSKPVVMLLPGLSPNVHWTSKPGFIEDAAWHLTTKRGFTVAVCVPRGSMDTTVHKNLFHGARVDDLRSILVFTRDALASARVLPPESGGWKCMNDRDSGTETPIIGAGFSMGGIILANYCGHFGNDAILSGAVAISAIYDAIQNISFELSLKTWQAFLCANLKKKLMFSRYGLEAASRGCDVERLRSRKTANLLDWDTHMVAVFNGYHDVYEYYHDLSLASKEKWKKVGVPLLAVASRDDPITHCDALHAQEFAAGNSNLLFLITEHGGHVGWPWGWRFRSRGWDFTSEAIEMFANSLME
jgi:predicted alpha/beta-fold hydrolase